MLHQLVFLAASRTVAVRRVLLLLHTVCSNYKHADISGLLGIKIVCQTTEASRLALTAQHR